MIFASKTVYSLYLHFGIFLVMDLFISAWIIAFLLFDHEYKTGYAKKFKPALKLQRSLVAISNKINRRIK